MGDGRKRALGAVKWLVPVAILSAAIGYSSYMQGQKGAEKEEDIAVPVVTTKPRRGDLVRRLSFKAHVESDSMVTVLPFISGILKEASVEVGDRVRDGQVIARIDDERFSLQLKQAEAAWLSAKSAWERVEQLYKAGAATQQSMEQARTQNEAYGAQYELAKMQFGYATVKSPVNGVVLARHLRKGDIASPERPLYTIGNLNLLVAKVKVPEAHYRLFSRDYGTIGVALLQADGRRYSGRIRSVSPYVSAETKNFDVFVDVTGDVSDLRPGMFVTVEFELERKRDALSLPFVALSESKYLWKVENDLASRIEFVPGFSADGFFEVPAEMADLDFAVEGQYFLREGSRVKVTGGSGK